MDWLLKNTLQQISIYFRYTKIRVLNFEDTPPYFLLKGNNKNHNFSQLLNFWFFWLNFTVNKKLQQLRFTLNAFQRLSKLRKNYAEKVKALHRICLATAWTKIFRFLFSLFSFAAVASPKRVDASISKKYVTVQSNHFQMH